MIRLKYCLKAACLASFVVAPLLTAPTSFAAQAYLRADVTRVFTDELEFGGCMAALSPAPSTSGLSCPDPWVTFSCTGDFNPKSVGAAKLAHAQLALVAGTQVVVKLDDARKHNSYCYATRIDNTSDVTQ